MARASARMLAPAVTPRRIVRAANGDLWTALRAVCNASQLKLAMRWVRGHAGNAFNERADALAREGATTRAISAASAVAASGAPARLSHSGAAVPGDPRRFLSSLAEELRLARLRGRKTLWPSVCEAWPRIHWRASARALHADDGPRGRMATRAANSALSFRLRALCGTLPNGVSLYKMGKIANDRCACGAVDGAEHWLVCGDLAGPLRSAASTLAAQLHATACSSWDVACAWSTRLLTVRAVACLVHEDDIEWYRAHVLARGFSRRHDKVTTARVVARAVHHASLLLEGVWKRRAAQLSAAQGRPDPRTESRADRTARLRVESEARAARATEALTASTRTGTTPPGDPAPDNVPRAFRRCRTCLSVPSRHSLDDCAALSAAHDRVAAVLRGAPISLCPGLAHAAPLV
jgi:hypothetical protein